MTSRDPALDRLFARYWDCTLNPEEWDQLNTRLLSDADAREWFREVCVQVVAASEAPVLAASCEQAIPKLSTSPRPVRRVSRRLALGFGLGSLAGLVAGAVLTRTLLNSPMSGARIIWSRGQVVRSGVRPDPITVGDIVPAGAGLTTIGQTSAAMLELPDGSTLCLSSDTTVAVSNGGERVLVQQGGATADLRPTTDSGPAVTVGTPLIALSTSAGADIDLTSRGCETELTVQRGHVAAESEVGVKDVRDGELLTVAFRGAPSVRPTPILPDTFNLDIKERLPEGWRVGLREETPEGPVIVPESWYDPYHSARMFQIRSHHQWTRGLVRVFPDSVVTVRYRAERTADGQVVLVVRRPRTPFKDCGCLEWNSRFLSCADGEWRSLTVRVSDMLDCEEAPAFAPPWVAFLLIFNTYSEDIGLRVADFRVTRPGLA